MDKTIEGKVVGTIPSREIPSLSTMSFEKLQEVSTAKRKGNSDRGVYKGNRTLKKAAAVILAAGAIFLSGMYVGANYSNELTETGNGIKSYFSQTAHAAENQKTTYNGGK